jgi:hypothetical protein
MSGRGCVHSGSTGLVEADASLRGVVGWVSILMGVDVTKVASACWSKDEGPGWAGC